MSDNLPKVAFDAFMKTVADEPSSITYEDTLGNDHFINNPNFKWDYLTPIEREAWYQTVAAILDAITPRSC